MVHHTDRPFVFYFSMYLYRLAKLNETYCRHLVKFHRHGYNIESNDSSNCQIKILACHNAMNEESRPGIIDVVRRPTHPCNMLSWWMSKKLTNRYKNDYIAENIFSNYTNANILIRNWKLAEVKMNQKLK